MKNFMKTKVCLLMLSFVSVFLFTQKSISQTTSVSNYKLYTTQYNSVFNEYPTEILKANNKLVVNSGKKIGAFGNKNKVTNEYYTNLYCFDIIKTDDEESISYFNVDRPKLFSSAINTPGDEGEITISKDCKTMFFSRPLSNEQPNGKLYKILMEPEKYGAWQEEVALPINDDQYSFESPCLGKDEKRLYFSSNKPGGFGGYDLYYVDLNEDGTYGQMTNLGSTINTNKDEKYPRFDGTGSIIYFSSNGHDTLGGYDVFLSDVIGDNEFTEPLNLGSSFNTVSDEISIIPSDDYLDEGYLGSNREGSLGNFDVYSYVNLTPYRVLKGKVIDEKTNEEISEAEIGLKDSDGNTYAKTTTDENGNYVIREFLPNDKTYVVEGVKTDYEDGHTSEFSIANSDSKNVEVENVRLRKVEVEEEEVASVVSEITKVNDEELIALNPIVFPFDSSYLTKEGKAELDRLVDILNKYPTWKIAIRSHTDIRGDDNYNEWLSDRRAKRTYDYLISKNIAVDRLVSHEGFGERILRNEKCTTDEACTEEEHQENRRSEFVIVEK